VTCSLTFIPYVSRCVLDRDYSFLQNDLQTTDGITRCFI